MPLLGVNIDHVATIRQARYRGLASKGIFGEPDPVLAAHQAELAGAEIITVHLREDRRHVNDRDVLRLRESITAKLNLEMAATSEMVRIARALKPVPQMCTLVPEGRAEVTTEGGLDVARHARSLRSAVSRLHDAGILVSAFIDAEPRQIDAAAVAGFDACEIHTGPFAAAFGKAGGDFRLARLAREHHRVSDAGTRIMSLGMQFNAGHALNYLNVRAIAAIPGIAELHIGHAIVSRAVFTGLHDAVREMKRLMESA